VGALRLSLDHLCPKPWAIGSTLYVLVAAAGAQIAYVAQLSEALPKFLTPPHQPVGTPVNAVDVPAAVV
jgi:hypothetical protein